jgi:hypothetical protein
MTIDEEEAHVYEVKDGDNFDTKKSEGELESLLKVQQYLQSFLPNKKVYVHIVLWNAKDVKQVSFKARNIPANFIVLGTEFCEKYGIDWNAIRDYRRSLNKAYVEELIKLMEETIDFIKNNEQ